MTAFTSSGITISFHPSSETASFINKAKTLGTCDLSSLECKTMPWFCSQIADYPFCNTQDGDRGRGEDDEEDELAQVVYQDDTTDDVQVLQQQPAMSYSWELDGTKAPAMSYSLPWADLDGTKEVKNGNGMSYSLPWADLDGTKAVKNGNGTRDGLTEALLPWARGSTGASFNKLYRPIFINGVPSKAYLYKPDHTDYIDVAVSSALRALSNEASSLLALLRVEPGRYEIEGRTVTIYEGSKNVLLVHEGRVGEALENDMPLPAYINLAANVALDLHRHAKEELSCADHAASINDPTLDGDDRYAAMQIATTQAKLREQSAERQYKASLHHSPFSPSKMR